MPEERVRLKGDIDLTRHVRTPAGVAYFHLPIGSPIGGGHGRGTSKVQLAKVTSGPAATNPAAVFLHQTVTAKATASNPAADFLHQTPSAPKVKPKRPASMSAESPTRRPKAALFQPKAAATDSAPIKPDVADVVGNSLPSAEDMAKAQMWWTKHTDIPIDSAKIKEELGVKFPDLGVKELRKRATDKKSTPEQRAEYKAELAHRVHLAHQGVAEQDTFIARLTQRLRDKPDDADLAPIIGETLAAHPSLGPLALIWDHIRKTGHSLRKEVNSEKFVDKAGDVAKGVGAVLLAGLLLHLGVYVPGLVGGG
jgi:hypothetical protein